MSVFAALFGVNRPADNESDDNLLKIETGKYTGNGKYGESNSNSITFGIKPRVVYIFRDFFYSDTSGLEDDVDDAVGSHAEFYYADGKNLVGFAVTASKTVLGEVVYTIEDKTLSWYSDDGGAACQLNRDRTVYYYIAIGT